MAGLLFIAEKFPPDIGGVAASAGRLVSRLASLGQGGHVFALTRDLPAGQVQRITLPDGVILHRFGQSKNLDFTLQQALTYLEWLHSQQAFALVWGHYAQTAGFLAAWLGRTLSLRSVISVRGNDFDRQLFPPGDLARLRWMLETTDQIVCVSDDLRRKVNALIRRDSFVLPNSVDTAVFSPRDRVPTSIPLLGFSGELRAKKGLNFLLQALADIRKERPARLLVIGEVRGGDRGEWERLRVSLNLDDAIEVTGHIAEPAEVAAQLRRCDVFVLPSLWEGMPNGLLEALACGVPVVASDAGGIPEILTDQVNGVLVPRTHLHQLGRRILELLRWPDSRLEEVRQAGLQTIREQHSPEVERRRLQVLLTSMSS